MEAPEKIYLSATENGTHYYTEGIPFEREFVEYARTDALIEKACQWLRIYVNPIAGTYLIDKDIEKFRIAMKGE